MFWYYPLFALTIFISSFLLFQVQPLIGKHLLPWYGGSSAIWVTAMFFFMVALAVGYLYALWLSKLRPLFQVGIHFLVVSGTLVSLYLHSQLWPSAITPTINDITISFTGPVLAVFATLFITIGLPFTLLSSSSSLLQLWYAAISGREPFSLYGISNIGSLLGLLSYPLFFEPFFNTYTQGLVWSYGVLIYALLMFLIMAIFIRRGSDHSSVSQTSDALGFKPAPTISKFLVWVFIASVPVMILLAGTSFMTVSIAPIPFLWVGPLALYLLSFIFTFRNGDRPPVWANEVFVVLASLLTLMLVVMTDARVVVMIVVTHLALFSISHWCHEYLYALRPDARQLTLFYVALSLGGILGSVVIKISNSYLFTLPIELMFILVASCSVIAYRWYRAGDLYLPTLSQKKLRIITSLIIILLLSSSAQHIYSEQKNVIAQERNFFGYKAVVAGEWKGTAIWSMQHGLTNHGFQARPDGQPVVEAVSYYGDSSGIGKAFFYLKSQSNPEPKVIVAGLGSGGLAAYCKEGMEFTFVEIDQEVIELAKEYFTYLEACPGHILIQGDARLVMEKKLAAEAGTYDLVILDAYADDMMPVHLMTTEAVAVYKNLLAPGGILAIHISSRYLDLLPVLNALTKDNQMFAKHWFDQEPEGELATASRWVVLAKEEAVLNNQAFANFADFSETDRSLLWTDTYSALLPIIRF